MVDGVLILSKVYATCDLKGGRNYRETITDGYIFRIFEHGQGKERGAK